jgi:hypothetical protein
MPRRVVRSQHFWISGGLLIAFCLGVATLEVKTALTLSNSLLLVASLVVGLAYLPVAYRAVRDGASPTIQHLAIGIVYAWFFNAIWRVLSIIWLTSGQPPELVNNYVISFCQAAIALGALYHVTSPGALGVSYRRRGLAVGAIVAAAFAFAVWMIVDAPDTRPIASALIPWLPR